VLDRGAPAHAARREGADHQAKKKAVAEFDFKKGIIVAIFSGLTSAGMNFGLNSGPSIISLGATTEPFTTPAWRGMPVLVVVLLGGFTINALWCMFLNVKNKTTGDYLKSGAPILNNIIFAGLAGAIWCSQFVFLKTGEPAMGETSYVGWAVMLACAILFGTLLGVFMGEWKGTGSKTRGLLTTGLALLVLSAVIAGYSGKLGQEKASVAADAPAVIEAVESSVAP
jgi:L-rhamnose-H+ transport protein